MINRTIIGTVASSYKSLNNGLLAYWVLNEGSGNAADSSGNGVTGASANISYSSGYTFNGTSSKVTMGNKVKPTTSMSIFAMLKTTTTAKATIILDCHKFETYWKGFEFFMNGTQMAIELMSGTATYLDYETNPSIAAVTIADGAWHFVGVTWNGTTVYLYLDTYKSSGSAYSTGNGYSTTNILAMGYDAQNNIWSNGSIKKVGVWNRAITADEITRLYNNRNNLNFSL